MQSESEEAVRYSVRRCVEEFRTFDIPKLKQGNQRQFLITLSLALIAIYVSLRFYPCSFYANLRSERMGCCYKSLPQISLRNIFRKIRCIFACCGGKIVIQASDIDGGEISQRTVLQSRKPSKLWWRRFHISRCKKRC